MSRVSHFRDLVVWQRGMDLVVAVYRISGGFPKPELYGLTSVLMAQASLAEAETQLEIATRLGYLGARDLSTILQETGILGKQLHALRDALTKKI